MGGGALKKTTNYGNYESIVSGGQTDRFPRSVIPFNVHNAMHKTIHPTQKPVSLFEYLIRTYTNEGEIVLDNCMGSFTTAIACINTNRNYIGFEMDENYFKIGSERVQKHLQSLIPEANLFSKAV